MPSRTDQTEVEGVLRVGLLATELLYLLGKECETVSLGTQPVWERMDGQQIITGP